MRASSSVMDMRPRTADLREQLDKLVTLDHEPWLRRAIGLNMSSRRSQHWKPFTQRMHFAETELVDVATHPRGMEETGILRRL